MELTVVQSTPLIADIALARTWSLGSALKRARSIIVKMIVIAVALLLLGNLAIVSMHLYLRSTVPASTIAAPEGVHNFQVVDSTVWRGSRPTDAGYRALAKAGVTTIVDLRAEEGLVRPLALIEELGIELVHIPMRDGQTPTSAQVATFLDAVKDSSGIVYVHCMAGVGRTGTMVAAYVVEALGKSPATALKANMAVGPPSLEQIAFVAGDIDRPNPVVTAFSRFLDGPRRIWTYIN